MLNETTRRSFNIPQGILQSQVGDWRYVEKLVSSSIQRRQAYRGWDDTRTLAFAITYIGARANLWYTQEEANGTAPEGWQDFSRRLVARIRAYAY